MAMNVIAKLHTDSSLGKSPITKTFHPLQSQIPTVYPVKQIYGDIASAHIWKEPHGGRNSSDGIAIRYGLDGPGIEFWLARSTVACRPTPGVRPTSRTKGTRMSPEVKRTEPSPDNPRPSSAEVANCLEVYCSPVSMPARACDG
jgi:hypothetical protein